MGKPLDKAKRFFVFKPVEATIGEMNTFDVNRAAVISS
jgi:hypothetical protein